MPTKRQIPGGCNCVASMTCKLGGCTLPAGNLTFSWPHGFSGTMIWNGLYGGLGVNWDTGWVSAAGAFWLAVTASPTFCHTGVADPATNYTFGRAYLYCGSGHFVVEIAHDAVGTSAVTIIDTIISTNNCWNSSFGDGYVPVNGGAATSCSPLSWPFSYKTKFPSGTVFTNYPGTITG